MVGWTYDARVGFRGDAGVLGAEGVNDAAEAQVDTTGHEGGRDGQAYNLHLEESRVSFVRK